MIVGYARVSTEDQHLDAQTSALKDVGADRIFAEKVSGTKRTRPELERMIDQLRDGDVVVVKKYDRLSRSLQDLLSIVEAIRAEGAGFRSLAEDIDTTTPAGRLVFHVFASIAQFVITLKQKHLRFRNGVLHVTFTGKGGKRVRRQLADGRLMKVLAQIRDLPGAELISWVDSDDQPRCVSSACLSAYHMDGTRSFIVDEADQSLHLDNIDTATKAVRH